MATEREQGTASLELVILAPVMFAVLSLILVFGRYAETEGKLDQAARDGARAATAQNSRSEAETIARDVVDEALTDAPESCRNDVDVEFDLGPGAYEYIEETDPSAVSYISVRVSCDVDLTDLGPLPLNSATIDQTFTSPLDRYRGVAE
ncbi:pilus assembly protein [Nocardioidaceae bacterium SCSIO 66511]|nr:pilus assembly protein [Nocardioidaceae bacterium SCSIO 66511]